MGKHKLSGVGLQARLEACDILYAILVKNKSLDEAFIGSEETSERGFVKALLTITLRFLGEIDFILFQHINNKKPLNKHYALMILRIGAAQLLFMQQKPYAVVDVAVKIASQHNKARHFAPLINAVLRKVADNKNNGNKTPLSINTPDWIWQAWLTEYGEQKADKIATAHLEESPMDLSFYPTPPEFEGTLIGKQTLRLKNKTKVENLAGFNDGSSTKFWVQDIAASLPASLLGNVKGKNVLEYGAAPGGKSAQLLSLGAELTALEISPIRTQRFQQNMKRLSFSPKLIIADGKTYQASEKFSFILLDSPCSGTGTARRHPELLWRRNKIQLKNLVKEQYALLESAQRNLANGGVLVYAVCSLQKMECLEIINHFLKNYPHMQRLPIKASEIAEMSELITIEGDVRSLPFHQPNLLKQKNSESPSFGCGGMDGFYIARLQKTDS